jgi:hypothetical protein
MTFSRTAVAVPPQRRPKKKADAAEHPAAFEHVGLLVNGPPSASGLPFS